MRKWFLAIFLVINLDMYGFVTENNSPDSILCHYAPPHPPGGHTVTERLVFKQSIGPVCHNRASTQEHSEHQQGPI